MKKVVSRIRRPVKREGADLNLLLTLLSFAFSVGTTRLFLELTGYPQLGGGEYHIAHVLWGGLLLFGAALLPLIFANRWVYRVGALTAGVGVGLFIDEVGKFITASNDYFHPAAAPIVYAFFLLTLLVYQRVRRPPRRSPRAVLYRALDSLGELLDQDLDAGERQALLERLEFVSEQGENEDLATLATAIKNFLQDDSIRLAPDEETMFEKWLARIERWEQRVFPLPSLRPVLAGLLLGLAVVALYGVGAFVLPDLAVDQLEEIVTGGRLENQAQLGWFIARIVLQGAVGLMLLASALLFVLSREHIGIGLGFLALLVSLTTVNLLVFYFNQFSAILKAALEFGALLALARFRHRLHLAEASEKGSAS